MKTTAVKITDGTNPALSCQSLITQIKILANHPFTDQEIHDVFQMISKNKISLQRITIHANQIVFSVPFEMTNDIIFLFSKSEYLIKNNVCAAINISEGQINDIPELTAKIIKALGYANVLILQLITSQSFVSVLIEQQNLTKARSALREALQLPFGDTTEAPLLITPAV